MRPSTDPALPLNGVRALVFDLMGTCTDWSTSIQRALASSPPLSPSQPATASISHAELAAAWRAGFFQEIHARFAAGLPQEDIDVTHRRVLDTLLAQHQIGGHWDEAERGRLVRAWHNQTAWPDAVDGLAQLRARFDGDLVVLANGTTRLQLDIVRSAGLPFHALFSSQLLGLTKPDPRIYERALELLGVQPHEAAMVAAHAYDLRAARNVGMRTVYIQRSTEDPAEDMQALRAEFDCFVDGTDAITECGLMALAESLGAGMS